MRPVQTAEVQAEVSPQVGDAARAPTDLFALLFVQRVAEDEPPQAEVAGELQLQGALASEREPASVFFPLAATPAPPVGEALAHPLVDGVLRVASPLDAARAPTPTDSAAPAPAPAYAPGAGTEGEPGRTSLPVGRPVLLPVDSSSARAEAPVEPKAATSIPPPAPSDRVEGAEPVSVRDAAAASRTSDSTTPLAPVALQNPSLPPSPSETRPGVASESRRESIAEAATSVREARFEDPGNGSQYSSQGDAEARHFPSQAFGGSASAASTGTGPTDIAFAVAPDASAQTQLASPAALDVASAPRPETRVEALHLQVERLAEQGGGTARLRLNPPQLGEIELEVRLRGGAVEVRVVANEAVARSALEEGRGLLMDGLSSRALRMEHFEVSGGSDEGRSGSGSGGGSGRDSAESEAHARGEERQLRREAPNGASRAGMSAQSRLQSVFGTSAGASGTAPHGDRAVDLRV